MIYELVLPNMHYPSLNTRRSKLHDGGTLRQWREAAGWAARESRVPALTSKPTIRLRFWPGDNRRRDAVNLALVHKACVDGLVDVGVIEDDSPDHIDEMMPAIHKGKGERRWVLEIVERADDLVEF